MENYQGDLTDILRASGGGSMAAGNISSAEVSVSAPSDWQQFPSNQIAYPPTGIHEEPSLDEFGDPFSNIEDPFLLHEINQMPSSGFFDTGGFIGSCGGGGGRCNNSIVTQGILDDHEIKRPPNNNFSRMLQISPNAKLQPVSPRDSQVVVAASPREVKKPPMLVNNDMINAANHSKASLMENAEVQISSPGSMGIKKRKSQAKKVVCIPAPAPANSRPSGEVIPSDLWAWRKYGQKPIKGSPYPRGYYRCSSSKGCSARKQVERSRTDPNMLVITYTSEHNHPWPTQRNALAGSTRSQPAKSNSNSKTASTTSSQAQKATNLKEEEKAADCQTDKNVSSPIVTGSSGTCQPAVKEEIEMEDLDQLGEGFPQSYKPALPDSNHTEGFFADLGDLEADPLNLLFTSGDVEIREDKSLDPFSFYDWTSDSTMTTTTTTAIIDSSTEATKGL